MPDGEQPREAVEDGGGVITVNWRRFPSVQRHPHPQRLGERPGLSVQRLLGSHRRGHRPRGAPEGGVNRIADGLEEDPW